MYNSLKTCKGIAMFSLPMLLKKTLNTPDPAKKTSKGEECLPKLELCWPADQSMACSSNVNSYIKANVRKVSPTKSSILHVKNPEKQ